MPRYNVEHNGEWACFSSISDAFITRFMDISEYEEWRKKQYGVHDFRPLEKCNKMTIEEAAFSVRLRRTHDDAIKCLIDCGLPKQGCEQIIYDIETKCYCPTPKPNGKYECPNCHKEIEKGQLSCDRDDCNLEFIWR